jgi:hypothetical protein
VGCLFSEKHKHDVGVVQLNSAGGSPGEIPSEHIHVLVWEVGLETFHLVL